MQCAITAAKDTLHLSNYKLNGNKIQIILFSNDRKKIKIYKFKMLYLQYLSLVVKYSEKLSQSGFNSATTAQWIIFRKFFWNLKRFINLKFCALNLENISTFSCEFVNFICTNFMTSIWFGSFRRNETKPHIHKWHMKLRMKRDARCNNMINLYVCMCVCVHEECINSKCRHYNKERKMQLSWVMEYLKI